MHQHCLAHHLHSEQLVLIFEGVHIQFLDFVYFFDAEFSYGCLSNRFTIVQVSMAWCIVVIQIHLVLVHLQVHHIDTRNGGQNDLSA